MASIYINRGHPKKPRLEIKQQFASLAEAEGQAAAWGGFVTRHHPRAQNPSGYFVAVRRMPDTSAESRALLEGLLAGQAPAPREPQPAPEPRGPGRTVRRDPNGRRPRLLNGDLEAEIKRYSEPIDDLVAKARARDRRKAEKAPTKKGHYLAYETIAVLSDELDTPIVILAKRGKSTRPDYRKRLGEAWRWGFHAGPSKYEAFDTAVEAFDREAVLHDIFIARGWMQVADETYLVATGADACLQKLRDLGVDW